MVHLFVWFWGARAFSPGNEEGGKDSNLRARQPTPHCRREEGREGVGKVRNGCTRWGVKQSFTGRSGIKADGQAVSLLSTQVAGGVRSCMWASPQENLQSKISQDSQLITFNSGQFG